MNLKASKGLMAFLCGAVFSYSIKITLINTTEAEFSINAARASKPGSVSTELKLRSEKDKSITCGCFPQSYGSYEVRKKTRLFVKVDWHSKEAVNNKDNNN